MRSVRTSPLPDPVLAARYRALVLAGLGRTGAPGPDPGSRILVVDAARQRLGLLEAGRLVFEAIISTAKNGLGCEEGSYRTPTGWHRLHARIGAGAEPGAVFKAQQPTGEVWRGEARDEDLILTRVLTLDGLEEGWNRGPGCDSRQRWIYLHGTNQEHQLGQPVSHGCVRLSNADVAELFDRVSEGDLLLISEGESLDPLGLGRLHFAGVAGSGMSALAQFVAMKGGRASGSDRSFDRGQRPEARAQLEALGIALHPQDGSGLEGAGLEGCAALVVSTAVEDEVPDVAAARRRGVPVLHRSELLAHLVARYRTVAVTGTSGKSTTTAMVFEILRGAGLDPSVITGGELGALQREGRWGNAWAGTSDLLVIEADESDGSVVRYHAAVGVILNLQKDHKEMEAVAEMFRVFRAQIRETAVVGEAENLVEFVRGASVFGFGPGAGLRAEDLRMGPAGSTFTVQGVAFHLPVPGRHNVENALAALAACAALGVSLDAMAAPLAAFQGVARRFQVLGERRGVTVVDDFGHNPAKVAASLRAAHLRAERVLAVFQPHGFGPLKFLRSELVAAFAVELAPQDRLWFLDVFYAGGTAARDIGSAEVVEDLRGRGVAAEHAPSREWLRRRLAAEARAGDLVLVMGARDPSLTDLARGLLRDLSEPELEDELEGPPL